MVQELIAYLIISIAFGILILKIMRFLNLNGKKAADSSTCGGCSTGCAAKELYLAERKKSKKQDLYKFYL